MSSLPPREASGVSLPELDHVEDKSRDEVKSPALTLPKAMVRSERINFLWTAGLTGQSLGLPTEPTQVSYEEGSTLGLVTDLYDVSGPSVGEGSFGVVYLCRHRKSDRKCVVKFVPQASVDDTYLEEHRDRDMFGLLLKISSEGHPNVVRYLDFFMSLDTVYVVMEVLEGEELLDRLVSSDITQEFSLNVIRQGLRALEYIHGHGIIHRDVKLNALRFRGAGSEAEIALFDFGHACHASNEKMDIVGTVLYIAPEVFRGRYTTQVDVWAFGVIAYVLLTGLVPFDFEDGLPRAVSTQVLQAALADSQVRALKPLPLDFLEKLLVLDPKQRSTATAALQHEWLSSKYNNGETAVASVARMTPYSSIRCGRRHHGSMSSVSMESPDTPWHPIKDRVRTSDPAVVVTKEWSAFQVESGRPELLRQHSYSWHVGDSPNATWRLGRLSLGEFALASVAQGATGMDVVSRPQGLTFNEAVLTMVINCVGAGVVLFPKIMADVGMLIAPLLCIICALTCKECGVMITAASEMAEAMLHRPIRTYEELASFSAPSLKWPLIITKNLCFLGFIVAYMQLVMDSVVAFFDEEQVKDWIPYIRFGVVLPSFCFLAMIKDLKQLARFSALGISAVIIECLCIMVGGLLIMHGSENKPEYSVTPAVTIGELPGACGKYIAIFLFSFAIIASVPTVRAQLEDTREMHDVLSRSFFILIFINCAVMLLGYLGFGSETDDNVIVGGISHKYPLIGKVGNAAVIFSVLLSTPLLVFCVMSVIESSGRGRICQPLSVANIILRLSLILSLCLIGGKLPYVTEVIGMVSSVFACCNNILFPAVFHYMARRKAGTNAKHPFWRKVKYNAALIVGLCVLVFGFKGSLDTLLQKLEVERLAADNIHVAAVHGALAVPEIEAFTR